MLSLKDGQPCSPGEWAFRFPTENSSPNYKRPFKTPSEITLLTLKQVLADEYTVQVDLQTRISR